MAEEEAGKVKMLRLSSELHSSRLSGERGPTPECELSQFKHLAFAMGE